MTDTPQGAWMREYERRRSDLYNAAYDVGDARNGQDEERAEAVAAIARKDLDAHVRGLVEENDRLREALDVIEAMTKVARNALAPKDAS